jgi:DNA-binding XRE family transcriptional regulator/predicted DNA-binding transcriptional regulator AlpA
MKSESRKIERTPEEQARLKAIREKFQREKPSLRKLVESGDAPPPVPLGTYLEVQALLHRLRKEREAAGLSLADVAERTGMDRAAISRLENGHQPNPTIDTLARYAAALGKTIVWSVSDLSKPESSRA